MRLILFFTFLIFIQGCEKTSTSNCSNVRTFQVYSNSPVLVGQTIEFGFPEVGGYRTYRWIGPNFYDDQYPSDSIVNAEFKNEGWYYLNLNSLDGDCQRIDSVYIDILFEQGSPSCSTTNNTVSYNNMSTDIYTNVQKLVEPIFSQKALKSSSIGTDLSIIFHTNWRNKEPEDGIYYTTNSPVFDQTDFNYNKLFVTVTKSSIYWSSVADQRVFVSHIGGRLQVRYCDLIMGGNNGQSYTTRASGNIIEQ